MEENTKNTDVVSSHSSSASCKIKLTVVVLIPIVSVIYSKSQPENTTWKVPEINNP
jgi:hypothetical protein